MTFMVKMSQGILLLGTCGHKNHDKQEADGWVMLHDDDIDVLAAVKDRSRLSLGEDGRLVVAEDTTDYFELAKQAKRDAIQAGTEALIAQGFPFDGKAFALDADARIKALGLGGMSEAQLASVLPIQWPAIGGQESVVVDATNVSGFVSIAIMYYSAFESSGSTLNDAVNICTTEDELALVADQRVWPMIPPLA